MVSKTCGFCKFWYDFQKFYEDPEEPHDFGFCENKKHKEECTAHDETCEHFEIDGSLKNGLPEAAEGS